MNKNTLLPLLGTILLSVMGITKYNSNAVTHTNISGKEARPNATMIDGAWETVWQNRNDTLSDLNKWPQFKIFSNGCFALIGRDSTGKITHAGFGKYELLDSKNYKETFLYHNYAPFVGGIDWQEYELKGDTLYTKGFNKVIVGGKEVTADFPRIKEKWVRTR